MIRIGKLIALTLQYWNLIALQYSIACSRALRKCSESLQFVIYPPHGPWFLARPDRTDTPPISVPPSSIHPQNQRPHHIVLPHTRYAYMRRSPHHCRTYPKSFFHASPLLSPCYVAHRISRNTGIPQVFGSRPGRRRECNAEDGLIIRDLRSECDGWRCARIVSGARRPGP
jgi:hypothetical protein